jgi:hypothetical protein
LLSFACSSLLVELCLCRWILKQREVTYYCKRWRSSNTKALIWSLRWRTSRKLKRQWR